MGSDRITSHYSYPLFTINFRARVYFVFGGQTIAIGLWIGLRQLGRAINRYNSNARVNALIAVQENLYNKIIEASVEYIGL